MVVELDTYEKRILETWEEVYKKGQLTFWMLLSLKKHGRSMIDMKKFIQAATNELIVADDKSMYRALRRLVLMDLALYDEQKAVGKGPATKVYTLTENGTNVLSAFIERNITGLLFKPEIKSLLLEERHG